MLMCCSPSNSDVLVRLVREDPEVAFARDGGDALQIGARQDAAARVVRRVDVEHLRARRDRLLELVEVVPPAERLVQRTADRHAVRRQHVPDGGRPLRIGHDHLVARLEQRLHDGVDAVHAAVGHQNLLGALHRRAVLVAQLLRDELAQARQAVGLQVVGPVVGNRLRHRRLHRVRGVEADVALVEPERVLDRVHEVADEGDAREWNRIEIFSHGRTRLARGNTEYRSTDADRQL